MWDDEDFVTGVEDKVEFINEEISLYYGGRAVSTRTWRRWDHTRPRERQLHSNSPSTTHANSMALPPSGEYLKGMPQLSKFTRVPISTLKSWEKLGRVPYDSFCGMKLYSVSSYSTWRWRK